MGELDIWLLQVLNGTNQRQPTNATKHSAAALKERAVLSWWPSTLRQLFCGEKAGVSNEAGQLLH